MTSKHFIALGLMVGGFAAVGLAGTGCGGGGTGGTGSGGATASSTTATTTTVTTSTSTTSTTVATGTGGAGGMGNTGCANHSFDTASPIGVGAAATACTLQDAVTPDYFTFMGTKGERVLLVGDAQRLVAGSMNLNDATVVDTVITVYDANKMPIAQDDDEHPRNSTDSQLFTELPADGQYYISVEDCNSYAANHPGVMCAPAGGIMTFDYTILLADLKDTNAGTMQDGTTAKGVPVVYTQTTTMGVYNSVVIDGNFKSTTDKHVFTVTPPANLMIDPQARPRAYFYVQPFGVVDGDGTTSNIKIFVTDDMAGAHIIASSDQNNYTNGDDGANGPMTFSFPLDQAMLVKPYYVFVQNTSNTSKPASDFYFILHEIGSVNFGQAEKEGVAAKGTNDTMATAEVLTVPGMDVGAYFVDAQIGAAGDVDWFSVAVPAMVATSAGMGPPDHLEFDCDTARAGSGLTGFTAVLLANDGTTALSTIGPEVTPAKSELRKGDAGDVALPATAAGKNAFIKVSATGQDAMNTGAYYHCNAFFFSTM